MVTDRKSMMMVMPGLACATMKQAESGKSSPRMVIWFGFGFGFG